MRHAATWEIHHRRERRFPVYDSPGLPHASSHLLIFPPPFAILPLLLIAHIPPGIIFPVVTRIFFYQQEAFMTLHSLLRTFIPWPLVLLLSLSIVATVEADEVILKNGDRLTGTVVSAKEGKLTFNTPYAGDVAIAMDAIASINSDTDVTLRFNGKEVLNGKLATDDDQITLQASEVRGTTPIDWTQVRSINVPDTYWDGNVYLGGTQQAGNTERLSVSFGADATRRSLQDRFSLSFLYNYAEEDGELTTRDTYGSLKYDYFFAQKFYGLLSLEMLKDKFKDLNLRTVVGPGVGYQLWEDDIKALALEAGIAYFSEDRVDGEDDQWITARMGANAGWQITPWLKFTDRLLLYPQFESLGDYTLRNEAAMLTSLGGSWSLRLANVLERDSDPAEDVKKNDSKTSLSLQYSF
jgi:putative salt-induced outer membrane protein YdiY